MMKKPNFIIPGAGRSGTTTLCNYLKLHPDIYVLWNKEPNYFSMHYDMGDTWYLRLFHNKWPDEDIKALLKKKFLEIFLDFYDGEQWLGEASTYYLVHPEVPQRMYEFNKNFKLIFILRNPIDRAFSNYKRDIQTRGEARPFEDIIKDDGNLKNCAYLTYGKYYTHISRFLKYFPKEQMHFILFEDFKKNPNRELRSTLAFLGFDSDFKFTHKAVNKNPSSMPISIRLQQLNYKYFSSNIRQSLSKRALKSAGRKTINFFNHLFEIHSPPVMADSTRARLRVYYQEEISKLESLLEKDLSHWK